MATKSKYALGKHRMGFLTPIILEIMSHSNLSYTTTKTGTVMFTQEAGRNSLDRETALYWTNSGSILLKHLYLEPDPIRS